MNMNKAILVLFCTILTVFTLLLSYNIILLSSNLTENQQKTIDFLNNKEELCLNYSLEEYYHLKDVKKVMKTTDYLFFISLLFCTLILTYYKNKQEDLKKLLRFGGITSLTAAGLIFIFLVISFNFTFTLFHNLFFPQGNWVFPIDSMIIQTFPISFFVAISIKIFILAIGLSVLSIILSKRTVFI